MTSPRRPPKRSGEEVAVGLSKKVKGQPEKGTESGANQSTPALSDDSVTPDDNGSSPLTQPPSTPDWRLPAIATEEAQHAELPSKNTNGGLVEKEVEKEVVPNEDHSLVLQGSALPKEAQAIAPTQQPRVLTAIPFISFLGDQAIETPMVTLAYAFPQTAARLLALDIYEPKCSELVNLAMVNPEKVSKDMYLRIHRMPSPPSYTSFFQVGMVTHSGLLAEDRARGLSVAFSDRTFPRAMSVVAQVLGQKEVVIPTFKKGASLSTYKAPRTTGSFMPSNSSPGGRSKLAPPSPAKNKVRSMSKLVYGNAVRAYGDNIPVYDGRSPFKMEKYQKLPRIYTEIASDAAVVAVFSLSWWGSGATQLSFNIQDVILLADVDFTEPEGPRVPSKPLWLVQPEEVGGIDAGDDALSSDNEGQLV